MPFSAFQLNITIACGRETGLSRRSPLWQWPISTAALHWVLLVIFLAFSSGGQAAATALKWDTVTSPQLAGQPIPVEIRAVDNSNALATEVNGPATISARGFEQVGFGTDVWWQPLYSYYEDSRTQSIYLSSEVGVVGNIFGIALDVATPPTIPLENFTIRMKHTTQAEYLGRYDWETSGWTVVYQATENIGQPGWKQFDFPVPFHYNGADNVMVDISFNNSRYDNSGYVRFTDTGDPLRSVYNYSDSMHGDPLAWSGDQPGPYYESKIPNMRFLFGDSVGISPSEVNLVNGQWSGSLIADGVSDRITLSAHHSGSGIGGSSNAFAVQDTLAISPAAPTNVAGPAGGPLTPGQASFVLRNDYNSPISVEVTSDQQWLSVPDQAITVPAFGETAATISLTGPG